MKELRAGQKNRKIALLLAIIMGFSALLSVDVPKMRAMAAYFNEDECNTMGYYRQTHTIPGGTLLYGFYLISLEALSDTIMERATLSATASGQDSMYYKSELDGNQWYKLDGASGISAITAGGELVKESDLDDLYIKYYVEPNGTVKDLIVKKQAIVDHYETVTRTSGWWIFKRTWTVKYPVFKIIDITDFTASIYDYPSPYNKWQMEEFQPLSEIMDSYLTSSNDEEKHWNYREIRFFMETSPVDSVTNLDDIILNNTAYVQSILYGSGSEIESEMANILYQFSDSTDAHRRVQFLENVLNVPVRTENKKYALFGWKFWYFVWSHVPPSKRVVQEEESDFKEIYYNKAKQWAYFGGMSVLDKWVVGDADAVVNEAIGQTAQNISDSINTYTTKVIKDPTDTETSTEIAKDKYDLYGIISAILASDPQEKVNGKYTWYDELYHYLNLYHIEQGVIARKDDELALLGDDSGRAVNDGLLIDRATTKYRERLFAGAKEHYYELVALGANDQVLSNELDDEAEVMESFRAELQFVIQARLNRTPAATRRTYLDSRLDYTNAMLEAFMAEKSEDPAYANAVLSIKKHIKWLSAQLSIALEEDGELTNLEKLIVEKEKLQEEYLAALDENDLTQAAILEAAIADIDYQIAEEIAAYSEVEGGLSYEDKAIESRLGTLGGLIENLTNKVIDDIDDGKTDSEALNALVMIGATDAIKELKDIFVGNSTFDKAIKNAENEFKESGLTETSSLLSQNSRPGAISLGITGNGDDVARPDGITENNTSDSGQSSASDDGSDENGNLGSANGDLYGRDRITNQLGTTGLSTASKDKAAKDTDPKTEKLLSQLDEEEGTKGLTSDEIEAVIEASLGTRLNKLSADGKIIAAVATGALGDRGYTDARNISKNIMAKCVNENNKYAYKTYKDSKGVAYVSLKTIDRISDFRYDFKIGDYTMENVGAGQIYHYSINSDEVVLSANKTAKMDATPVKFDDVVYVVGSEAKLHFDVTPEPVTDTDYSGALTSSMETKKNDLIKALVDAIKEKNQ